MIVAGALVAIVPSYISRSIAGSYDNEAVAIFAMVFTYYLWVKAVKTGKVRYAVATALAYFYMASAWGGYIFIINLIPLHVLGLIVTGRFSQRMYIAYSVFYPLATLLSMQVPFIGLKPFTTAEHIGPLGVFGLVQLIAIAVYARSKMPDENFQAVLRYALYGAAGIFAILFAFAVFTQRISPFTGRLYSFFNPSHAKKNNPIVASVSEHQPTAWSSYYFDLQFLVFTFPVGLYYCFSKLTDANIFIIIYALTSVYFSGVMVRLMLIVAPVMCVLGGIALSSFLANFYRNLQEKPMKENVKQPRRRVNVKMTKKEKIDTYPFKVEVGQFVFAAVALICLLYVRHCVWVTSEAYSSPSIILSGRGANGEQIIFDYFRESYSWLKENTHKDAVVMSWWDYGYQLSALADRITIVDNNTWNNTHIARVGQAMASSEERAYEIVNELDVDYVMVVFGGLIGYSSDDINKFLWMVRIGGSTPEGSHIHERDYFNEKGEYRVDAEGAPALLNSLAYKLCYYRFGSVHTEYGRPSGYDRVRRTEIGNKDIELKHFEEVYTSKHWMVRIYRVLKPNSHE